MGAIRDLVDELRRRGVTVQEWNGWDGRGNEGVGQIQPRGAVIHHTGSNYGSGYAGLVSSTRADLYGGMLCNFSGNDDGSLTVIGSGLAWHAGPGVGPSLGPVLSRIPNIRNVMNRVTVGLEIVYPGSQPMRPEQYQTACLFGRTVADMFAGGDVECVRAHAETNGNVPGGSGKWDPGCAPDQTIDMAAFRQDAAASQSGDDMFNPATDPYMQSMNGKLDRATIASEAVVAILSGDTSDGLDRLAEIWIRDGKTQDEVAALRAQVEHLASGGQAAPGGAPMDLDALAEKLADKLAARLAS